MASQLRIFAPREGVLAMDNAVEEQTKEQSMNGTPCLAFPSAMVKRMYRPGAVIFHDETLAFAAYFLLNGMVKLYVSSPLGQQVVRIVSSEQAPGALIELPSLTADRHKVSCEAMLPSQIGCVDKHIVRAKIQDDGEVALQLLGDMGAEWNLLLDRLRDTQWLSPRKRLIKLLIEWADIRRPATHAQEITIPIQLTRRELGAAIGTSMETAVRCLTELRQERLISTKGRVITILDYPRLKQSVESNGSWWSGVGKG